MKRLVVVFLFMGLFFLKASNIDEIIKDVSEITRHKQLAFNAAVMELEKNYPFQSKKVKLKSLSYVSDIYRSWLENSCEGFNLLKKYNYNNQFLGIKILTQWINFKGSIYDSENAFIKLKRVAIQNNNQIFLDEVKELKKLTESYSIRFNRILKLKKEFYNKSKKYLTPNISLEDLEKILKKENALYIDFASTNIYDYIFTYDYNGLVTIDEISKSDQYIKEFRNIMDGTQSLNTVDDMQYMLSIIFDKIFPKHIQDKLKKLPQDTTLIISPDGFMNFLPFESLVMDNRYLIEKFNIKYTPSAKELVRLNLISRNNKGDIVAFSKADFDAKVTSQNYGVLVGNSYSQKCKESILELTQQKLNSSSSQKKAKMYQNKNATEEKLLSLSNIKNLDIVTHGLYCKDKEILNPMSKTMLLMSGAKKTIEQNAENIATDGEGIVTALEISSMNLEGTDLVTLSACQTGLGEINDAEGVSSINKAFMLAGAKSVISTLWSVNINKTDELMFNFYKNKKVLEEPSKVLREVKLKFIKNKLHPYYWSGFVLYGE